MSMRTNRDRDVVIVGGGHNGLACATYLARGGLDVLVLERRAKLGGAAVTDEPWPGFQVSTASYVMSLMPPQVVDELNLKQHGYETSILAPDYFVPYQDGSYLSLWGDAQRCADEIAKFNKHDAAAYIEFDESLGRFGEMLHELMFMVPPNLSIGDFPQWARMAAKLRKWTGRDIADIVRLFTMSGADFLDEWFEDERVKGALGTQAVLGAWTGPMSPGSAYVLVHHWFGEVDGHKGAWAAVKGGMSGISDAMAASARAAGAELRTDTDVRRVVVQGGEAIGVELTDGTVVRAKQVISNTHPKTTYLDLVGEAHLPDEAARDIRRFRSRSGSVKVNIGLNALPKPAGWDGPIPGDPHTGHLRDLAVDRVPRARVGRRKVRPLLRGSVHRRRVPHRAVPRARARGEAPHVVLHAVRAAADPGRVGSNSRVVRPERDQHDRQLLPGIQGVGRARAGRRPARHGGRLRTARRQHQPGRHEPRPDVLLPADPRLRRLPHPDQGPVPLRRGHAPRRRRHGRERSELRERRGEGRDLGAEASRSPRAKLAQR